MDVKNSMFEKEEEKFPWDETTLKTFKKVIGDQGLKCRMDDIFLLGFLRARKFDLQRSLELLKSYYTNRMNYPEYFKDLLPSKLEHALAMNWVQFLPQTDKHGRHILVFQSKKWNTSVCNVYDMFRAIFLHIDLQLNYHRTQVNGVVAIVNAEGLTLSHFLQISPRLLNSIASVLFRDSYQVRYKEIHYVNVNVIMKALLSVFVPLLPNKLKKRIHFHSDFSTLHQIIAPEFLPSEFGGRLPSIDANHCNDTIRANEELFRKNEEYVNSYDEEIRKNSSQVKSRYIGEDVDEKLKKFIEKCEEKFRRYSQDPEGFLAFLQQDSDFKIKSF